MHFITDRVGWIAAYDGALTARTMAGTHWAIEAVQALDRTVDSMGAPVLRGTSLLLPVQVSPRTGRPGQRRIDPRS